MSSAPIITVAMVACCSKKSSQVGPARDVYRSPLFRMSLAYAEHVLSAQHTFILSAKHGAIRPDTTIEPYDLALKNFDGEELADWAHVTGIQLRDLMGLPFTVARDPPTRVVLLASDAYEPELPSTAQLERPLVGKRIGERLHWLRTQLESAGVARERWSGAAHA